LLAEPHVDSPKTKKVSGFQKMLSHLTKQRPKMNRTKIEIIPANENNVSKSEPEHIQPGNKMNDVDSTAYRNKMNDVDSTGDRNKMNDVDSTGDRNKMNDVDSTPSDRNKMNEVDSTPLKSEKEVIPFGSENNLGLNSIVSSSTIVKKVIPSDAMSALANAMLGSNRFKTTDDENNEVIIKSNTDVSEPVVFNQPPLIPPKPSMTSNVLISNISIDKKSPPVSPRPSSTFINRKVSVVDNTVENVIVGITEKAVGEDHSSLEINHNLGAEQDSASNHEPVLEKVDIVPLVPRKPSIAPRPSTTIGTSQTLTTPLAERPKTVSDVDSVSTSNVEVIATEPSKRMSYAYGGVSANLGGINALAAALRTGVPNRITKSELIMNSNDAGTPLGSALNLSTIEDSKPRAPLTSRKPPKQMFSSGTGSAIIFKKKDNSTSGDDVLTEKVSCFNYLACITMDELSP
jgi:hypothetical protein